jgi:hypothetical protein
MCARVQRARARTSENFTYPKKYANLRNGAYSPHRIFMHRHKMWTPGTPHEGPQKPSSRLLRAINAGCCMRSSENNPSTL